MNEDQSGNDSGKRTWVEKIGQAFSPQPRSRDNLLELLKAAADDGVIDADDNLLEPRFYLAPAVAGWVEGAVAERQWASPVVT